MRADLSVVGPQAAMPRRITTSGTAIEQGEPIHATATSSAGAASNNYYFLAAADTPTVGTHRFGGVAIKKALLVAAGTTQAQYLPAACPVPHIGQIRGKAEVAANVDTQTELNGLYGDYTLIDYSATGASDGGELYTIKDVASADTSGLQIIWGDVATQILAVTVDPNAYRWDFA